MERNGEKRLNCGDEFSGLNIRFMKAFFINQLPIDNLNKSFKVTAEMRHQG